MSIKTFSHFCLFSLDQCLFEGRNLSIIQRSQLVSEIRELSHSSVGRFFNSFSVFFFHLKLSFVFAQVSNFFEICLRRLSQMSEHHFDNPTCPRTSKSDKATGPFKNCSGFLWRSAFDNDSESSLSSAQSSLQNTFIIMSEAQVQTSRYQ